MSLPEITDEDRAVEAEAWSLYRDSDKRIGVAAIAAALVRTGWKKVDKDLILAREVCAKIWSAWPDMRVGYSAGAYDHQLQVQAILAAIKAVRREGERKG